MARSAQVTVINETPDLPTDILGQDMAAHSALAVALSQQQSRVRAIALRVGYQLPGDAIDPDLIQRDIAANMRRSVEACLEVGRGLSVLKEACEHGNFLARLDVLGMDRTVAARFMQAAAKFSNVATSHHLTKTIGTQSKLLELLVLDDEQIEELSLEGQTGELKLDDVATMSVKELRAKLREMRQEKEATQRLLADKNAKLDALTTAKLAVPHWEEKVGQFKSEIVGCFDLIDTTIGRLHLLHMAILNEEVKWGEGEDAERLILREFAVLYGDHLNRSAQKLAEVFDKYEATLAGWAGELEGHALFDADSIADMRAQEAHPGE